MDEQSDLDVPPEINVTPLIDVLMSLLIVFMASSQPPPKVQQPITLPTEAVAEKPLDPEATLLVTVDDKGVATLGKNPLPEDFEGMVESFKNNEKAQSDSKIAINASEKLPYGKVIRVVAAARRAGISTVSLASERVSGGAPGAGAAAPAGPAPGPAPATG